jgi:hypothetical protein
MKKFLLWSFERGSIQYDVICVVILAFIFLTPAAIFDDVPDFMRVSRAEPVRRSTDNDGNTVFNVKVDAAAFSETEVTRTAAIDRLKETLNMPVKVSRMLPLYDTMGMLAAYLIWIEKNEK